MLLPCRLVARLCDLVQSSIPKPFHVCPLWCELQELFPFTFSKTTQPRCYHHKLLTALQPEQTRTSTLYSEPKLTLNCSTPHLYYPACKAFVFLVQAFNLSLLGSSLCSGLLGTTRNRTPSMLYLTQLLRSSSQLPSKQYESSL